MPNRKPTRFLSASIPNSWRVPLGFAVLLAGDAVAILSIKSQWFANLLGRPLAGHLHYGPEPWHAAVIAAGIVLILTWRQERDTGWESVPVWQAAAGAVGFSLFVAAALPMTHPAGALRDTIGDGIGERTLPTVIAAARYSLVIIALVPGAVIVFPAAFLRRHRWRLLAALSAVLLYMWLGVLRVALHRFLGPWILFQSHDILAMLSSRAAMSAASMELFNGPFSVRIGPPCLGLDAPTLFVCGWSLLWLQHRDRTRWSLPRRFAGLVAGCILLLGFNFVRIVGIMLLGRAFPEMAAELFHSAAGAVAFCVVFFLSVGLFGPPIPPAKTGRRKTSC